MVVSIFHMISMIFPISGLVVLEVDKLVGDRGTGERETWTPGEKGAGGVREAGEEGAGSGIPKVAGSRRKGGITQHCAIFCNRKNAKRQEPTSTGREPGLKGTGSGRFKPPCPPHKLTYFSCCRSCCLMLSFFSFSGYQLSNTALSSIILRYHNKKGTIPFDIFIQILVRVIVMFGKSDTEFLIFFIVVSLSG